MPHTISRSLDKTTAGAASGYIASEAHYLSVAGRILASLRGNGRLVLLTGDLPVDPEALCRALRKLVGSRRRVIGIACEPELTKDELSRAGSNVATLPAGGGTVTLSDAAETDAPLFVFAKADRLSDQQIKEICASIQLGAQQNTAAVLLASAEFPTRLKEQPLQFLETTLGTRLHFDEIGGDEGIDFLRHQLAARHLDDEASNLRPILLRGLAVLAAISAIVVGVLLVLHYVKLPNLKMPGGWSLPWAGNVSTATDAPQPVPAPGVVPSAPAVPPVSELPKPATAPAEPTPAPSSPAKMPEPPAPVATPGATRDAASPQAPPRSAQPRADQRLSPAEIDALLARGDAFLSTGDIASARLFYERAADAGSGGAALRLGATFDPNFLGRAGVRGSPGDPAQAASWYRRARDLGDAAAAQRLKNLSQAPH